VTTPLSTQEWEALSALAPEDVGPEHLDAIARVCAAMVRRCYKNGLQREVFERFQEHGIHVTPVHFYFPVPDTRALPARLFTDESALPGIDMNESAQLTLVGAFRAFQQEYDAFRRAPGDDPHEFYFDNPMFSGTDALVLYCMVRHARPRRVIEVGSGYSTRLSLAATRRNGDGRVVSIEPYPSEALRAAPGLDELIATPVQQVDLQLFETLEADDILFIDSSHVVRIGSDVNFLFLEVLPRLKPGVIVHVHDIYLPLEYRREWVVEDLRFWSEQYLLQAFLAFNSAFEVLLCNSYLERRHPGALRAAFPRSPWWGGGSFWMRRKPSAPVRRVDA
jgi:hypothetical protein